MSAATLTPARRGRADGDNSPVAAAARRLYDAECAAHAAHQSGVDAWVQAASTRLHVAVVEYLAALDRAA